MIRLPFEMAIGGVPRCSNWEHHETSKYQKVSKKVSKKVSQLSSDPHALMENKLDRVNTSVSKRSHKIQLGITKPYPGYGNTARPFRLRFQPSFLLMTLFSALIMTSKFQRYAIVNTSWKP